jgi:hypothetical protein
MIIYYVKIYIRLIMHYKFYSTIHSMTTNILLVIESFKHVALNLNNKLKREHIEMIDFDPILADINVLSSLI